MAWTHRLIEKDIAALTGVCATCGPVDLRRKGDRYLCKPGQARWNGRPHRAYKGDECARCGFVAEDPCQLDVHHLDENHRNNDPSNLQTLCANCHRLVTQQAKLQRPGVG